MFGSIPTGYLLIKKYYGIDIRTKGSGNIGSTNVKRVAGNWASIITQGIDILKGIIPVVIGYYVSKMIALPVSIDVYLSIIAIAVILGHDYTPFLSFKGGKGVNTTLGAFLFIVPIPTLMGVFVYFVLRIFTAIVSIRSMAFGITLPIICIVLKYPLSITIATVTGAMIMLIRHKDNLIRIINGEEK